MFHRHSSADVRDLIAEYPLAWVSAGTDASLLPLLGEYDDEGRLTGLLGHMARRNPLRARLAAAPAANLLFTGPQGYVSPAHAQRQNWGPTWNYAKLVIGAQVEFLPDGIDEALTALTYAMEGDGWTAAELGPRYAGMAAAVIAFRARVISVTGRFKLGQDEAPEVFAAICRNHPDAGLVRWMRRFSDA